MTLFSDTRLLLLPLTVPELWSSDADLNPFMLSCGFTVQIITISALLVVICLQQHRQRHQTLLTSAHTHKLSLQSYKAIPL